MSSRAQRALKASLGGGGGGAAVPGPGSSSPASRKRSRGEDEDEATSQSTMARRASGVAEEVRGRAGLPASLRALAEIYDRICFIFSIHANQERRSFRDLKRTFHQLSGGEVEIDDLRRLKAAYPNCLAFSYKGLPSKPLDLDLMVQIPRTDSLDRHKRNLRAGLAKAARARAEGVADVPLADLPERPLNRSLEASEKYVKRVIQSYSPKRAKRQRSSSSPSSSKIKSFFQTNKIISGRALTMVERTHDKTRKLFDETEKEARNRRRNLAQLPQVFDRVRGLFRSLGRRAMPMRDMVPHLMSMRKDKAVQQNEIEAQVDLIVAHAPEWCTVQCDTRKNRILSLNPGADPNQVRRKLNLLSQSQD